MGVALCWMLGIGKQIYAVFVLVQFSEWDLKKKNQTNKWNSQLWERLRRRGLCYYKSTYGGDGVFGLLSEVRENVLKEVMVTGCCGTWSIGISTIHGVGGKSIPGQGTPIWERPKVRGRKSRSKFFTLKKSGMSGRQGAKRKWGIRWVESHAGPRLCGHSKGSGLHPKDNGEATEGEWHSDEDTASQRSADIWADLVFIRLHILEFSPHLLSLCLQRRLI